MKKKGLRHLLRVEQKVMGWLKKKERRSLKRKAASQIFVSEHEDGCAAHSSSFNLCKCCQRAISV